jgi:hypothetical protein
VPEPNNVDEFSGKFVLRIPRVLHKSLDREARRQGVSLNQYILHLLSERNAITVLQLGVQETIPSLSMFADPHALWPEENKVCHYFFNPHGGATHGAESLLSNLVFVSKPPKDFRKVITLTETRASYES